MVRLCSVIKCQKFKDDEYLTFEELAKELKELPDYKLGEAIAALFVGKTRIEGNRCLYMLGSYLVNGDKLLEKEKDLAKEQEAKLNKLEKFAKVMSISVEVNELGSTDAYYNTANIINKDTIVNEDVTLVKEVMDEYGK